MAIDLLELRASCILQNNSEKVIKVLISGLTGTRYLCKRGTTAVSVISVMPVARLKAEICTPPNTLNYDLIITHHFALFGAPDIGGFIKASLCHVSAYGNVLEWSYIREKWNPIAILGMCIHWRAVNSVCGKHHTLTLALFSLKLWVFWEYIR